MRSLKTNGGLTRGTGFTDAQRSIWIKSMPICSLYNCAMQEISGITFMTSEQHKGVSIARINRDRKDFKSILDRFSPISPFAVESDLKNIANGFIAEDFVNVHDFYDYGKTMISKMVEGEIFKFCFKRKDKVRTLTYANSVKLPNSEESIDPCLLFQRLLVVASTSSFDVNDLSKYELSAYPIAIFMTTTMLRQADKPPLATSIYNKVKHQFIELFEESAQHQYVLDGGSLLHIVQWKQSSSYTQISESCANFVLKHYGNAMVVFDN